MAIVALSETFESTVFNNLPARKLGKAKGVKTSRKLLHLSNYIKPKAIVLPKTYNGLAGTKAIPLQDWGNTECGDCTIASQGEGTQIMERKEQRKLITFPAANMKQTYFNMVKRVYNTDEDLGAYEADALDNWRNADYTFRDTKEKPYTIDAYTAINHRNLVEVEQAIFLSGRKGIKACFALPLAWALQGGNVWDIPEGQQMTDEYAPYSWGGHSTWLLPRWDPKYYYVLSSWVDYPFYKISKKAFLQYADESYSVIDSANAWKKKSKMINMAALVSDVNSVSDIKLKA